MSWPRRAAALAASALLAWQGAAVAGRGAAVVGQEAAQAARPADDDRALLPPEGFLGAWGRSGPPRDFTSADLYGRIDGGAEVFLELGFERLLVQRYRNPAGQPAGTRAGGVSPSGAEIEVEIYRMSDATAARGIYLQRCGKEARDPALRERHTVSRHQLMLQRERYFLVVSNVGGHEAFVPALVQFAREIAGRLPADGPVPVLGLLPRHGLVAGSQRIVRGGVTLQAVYTLGDGDVLQLGGTVTAVAGDYAGPAAGSHTLVLADYPTPAAAAAAFKHAGSHLDSYLKVSSATATRLAFEDYARKAGTITLTGRRLELRVAK